MVSYVVISREYHMKYEQITLNDGRGGVCKKATVAYFKVLSRLVGTEKDQCHFRDFENSHQDTVTWPYQCSGS